jgi:hypothetical protein
MTGENENADRPHQRLTLEERIKAHLTQAPTDEDLRDNYIDPSDRERVRCRALITATLDAIFEHGFPEEEALELEVYLDAKHIVWSELASARRAYRHDVEFLDAGRSAQLILTPTKTDATLTEMPISAKVKELILWLAVIHLHQEGLDTCFPTQHSVIDLAAKSTRRQINAIRSELTNYTTQNRPSPTQIAHFWEQVSMAQALARTIGDEKGAFSLLLPAALALSESALRNAATAQKAP